MSRMPPTRHQRTPVLSIIDEMVKRTCGISLGASPGRPKASTTRSGGIYFKEHQAASTKTRESNVAQFQEELIPKTTDVDDEAMVFINVY
jgi:hypothetical protein